jgi:hypothetical protein
MAAIHWKSVSIHSVLALSLGSLLTLYALGASDLSRAGASGGGSISAYGGDLSAAVRAIGATEAFLIIDTVARIDGDTTIPATLGLVFRKGGRIEHGEHVLRIEGPIEAGPYRIFDGTGTMTIADSAVQQLFVEWWGGAADGATDSTPALASAVASMTHPTIRLLQGTYLGVVSASRKILTLQGAGKFKTILKNNRPNAHTIDLGGTGSSIADLKVDINAAKEVGVFLHSTYLQIQQMHIVNQGGKGKYAMHVKGCTLSAFNDLMFSHGTGGHLLIEQSYYSVFTNISSGEPGDEATIYIRNTAALSFQALYVEHGKKGSIVIENAQNVDFYGIGIEIADMFPPDVAFIRTNNCQAINFYGGRVNQYALPGRAMFDLKNTQGCTIDGWLLIRSVKDASPFIVFGAGLQNVQISNIEFWNDVPAIGVRGDAGAQPGNLILENLWSRGPAVNHQVSATNLSQRNIQGKVTAP